MIEIDQFLVIGNPEKYVPLNFTKFEDLEKNYSLLHKIHFDNKSRDYLLSMACDYILSKARNRKSVAKKVVYRLIKNSLGKTNDLTIIEKLFEVFKKFAFDCAEDNWKISLFLKDVVLTDQMILWLIENSSKNDLIANRILRYPVKNEIIADWAKVQIDKYYGSISRKSEVIGLALSDVFFEILNKNDKITTEELAWGIFYSKNTGKHRLLEKLLLKDGKCLGIARVSLRLGFLDLLEMQKIEICKQNF